MSESNSTSFIVEEVVDGTPSLKCVGSFDRESTGEEDRVYFGISPLKHETPEGPLLSCEGFEPLTKLAAFTVEEFGKIVERGMVFVDQRQFVIRQTVALKQRVFKWGGVSRF